MAGFWAGFGDAFQTQFAERRERDWRSDEAEKTREWEEEKFIRDLNAQRENLWLEQLMSGSMPGGGSGGSGDSGVDTVGVATTLITRFPEHEAEILEIANDPKALKNLYSTITEYEQEKNVRLDEGHFDRLVAGSTRREGRKYDPESLRTSLDSFGLGENISDEDLEMYAGMANRGSTDRVTIDYDYSAFPEGRMTAKDMESFAEGLAKNVVAGRVKRDADNIRSALSDDNLDKDSQEAEALRGELARLESIHEQAKLGYATNDVYLTYAEDQISRFGNINPDIYRYFGTSAGEMEPAPEEITSTPEQTAAPATNVFTGMEFTSEEEVIEAGKAGLIPMSTTHVMINGVKRRITR